MTRMYSVCIHENWTGVAGWSVVWPINWLCNHIIHTHKHEKVLWFCVCISHLDVISLASSHWSIWSNRCQAISRNVP